MIFEEMNESGTGLGLGEILPQLVMHPMGDSPALGRLLIVFLQECGMA